jgi:hypothetical protein
MDEFAGATVIETSAGPLTVNVVDDEIEPDTAVMVVVPSPELVARPFESLALLITLIKAEDEVHATTVVTS